MKPSSFVMRAFRRFDGPALLVLALVCVAAPSRAEGPVEFAPRGGWTADFAEDSCALNRTFAHEGDTVHLRLRQFVPGNMFEATVASETLDAVNREPRLRFATTAEPREVEFYSRFEAADGLEGIMLSVSFAPDRPGERAGSDFAVYTGGNAIGSLLLSRAFDSDLTILTGSLEQPLKIMESCMDDLLAGWGLDGQAHRTLSRKAEPTWNEPWLSVTAPMQREFRQQKGSNRQDVRLIIDEQGKPKACRVLQWPEDEPISRRLCDALLSKASMPPALDKDGNPIASYFVLVLSAIVRTEFR